MKIQNYHFPFLLITHLICSDGQIHSDEVRFLNKMTRILELDKGTLGEMDKILSQSDDCIALDDIIRFISGKDREETLKGLIAAALADNFCDPVEYQFLEYVAKRWQVPLKKLDDLFIESEKIALSQKNCDREESASEHLSFGAQVLQAADNIFSKDIVDSVGSFSSSFEDKITALRKEILLAGPEYKNAIQSCANIAREDLVYTKKALDQARTSMDILSRNLKKVIVGLETNTIHTNATTAKKVVSQLQADQEDLERNIQWNLEQLRSSLYKKQRAVNYFTISFLGKTKAGKSTLHAVVTGEGWEAIGVGGQRTTRLNRVYEWENVRIIDTPGIGAPGGRSDEEIAKSIIEETDVVCFVLTNNNQQETEFQFLKLLKNRAKPLIVLLNVKENLQQQLRFKRFLENPNRLFSKDKKRLGGHIDRIRQYALKFYGNDYFDIVPVQLLAAQLSRQNENTREAGQLFKASRLQGFLDSVRVSLIKDGPIRRSQTLLGCSVVDIETPHIWVKEKAAGYLESVSILSANSEKLRKRIKTAGQDALSLLETQIALIFQDLKNTVPSFAEDHWNDKETDLNTAWEDQLEKVRLKPRVESITKGITEDYTKEIRTIIEETGREFQLVTRMNGLSFNLSEQDSGTVLKNTFKWGGAILSALGTILAFTPATAPIIWGTVISGIVIGALSGLFTSKKEKQQQAVSTICSTLQDQICRLQVSTTQTYLKMFKEQQDEISRNIYVYFESLVSGLEGIGKVLDTTSGQLLENIDFLNFCYAKRILDWCEGTQTSLTKEEIDNTIQSVTRTVGKEMIITVKRPVNINQTKKRLDNILQENVRFERVSENLQRCISDLDH